eukprot:6252062-Alexandrium_andersonii.AAC.1
MSRGEAGHPLCGRLTMFSCLALDVVRVNDRSFSSPGNEGRGERRACAMPDANIPPNTGPAW